MNLTTYKPFTRLFGLATLAGLALSVPTMSFAAAPGATGIDAAFTTALTDFTGMLGGNFGALVLLISLIIGVAVYAVSSNWKYVISSVLIAFLIGYGVDIIQGIGGVTATVDMLATSTLQDVTPDGGLFYPATPAI